jgi:hypothetical protein
MARSHLALWTVLAPVLAAGVLWRTPPEAALPEPSPPGAVDLDIRRLAAPEGRAKYLFDFNPGGPVFEYSAPMKNLVARGSAAQPRLLGALQDPHVRNEVALILSRVGDKDALPHLIELLPTTAELTDEERFTTKCLLYALWQLTGMELGIHHKFNPAYTPEFRAQWWAWYESNRDYLYTPPAPKKTAYGWGRDRVLVDIEAKLVGRPTAAYRAEHPWIDFEEIRHWRDDPAYEQKLKDFCLSMVVNLSWNAYGFAPREAVRALGRVRDPRALTTLHALCALAEDADDAHDLIWTLDERGDPSSIPVIEKIPRPKNPRWKEDGDNPRRAYALERLRLLEKYRQQLQGKPFDAEHQMDFMRCLEGAKGVERLVAKLRDRKYDVFLSRYLRVAAYVDREPVRACLKEMSRDAARGDRARTMVHGALAKLGEKDSIDHLKQALTHKHPGVRLAAAEGLWGLGSREGFKTLLEILDVRPIETGGEGVQVGEGTLTVTALQGANVEYIRDACAILGEMGDRSAVEPLKWVLPLNLNGILGGGGSGSGWEGRPDAVALAKLGDFSGLAILRESIRRGDRLNVVGSWGSTGDFVAIGLRRLIPELLPMLDHHDESKRVQAAQAILLLLEGGK